MIYVSGDESDSGATHAMPNLKHIDLLSESQVKFGYYFAVIHHWLSGPSFDTIQKTFDISDAECAVVFTAALAPGLTATDICEITGRQKNTISRAVKSALKRKLIVRSPELKDRRRGLLELTQGGAELHKKMLQIFYKRETEMLSILSKHELRTLDALLRKLLVKTVGWATVY